MGTATLNFTEMGQSMGMAWWEYCEQDRHWRQAASLMERWSCDILKSKDKLYQYVLHWNGQPQQARWNTTMIVSDWERESNWNNSDMARGNNLRAMERNGNNNLPRTWSVNGTESLGMGGSGTDKDVPAPLIKYVQGSLRLFRSIGTCVQHSGVN